MEFGFEYLNNRYTIDRFRIVKDSPLVFINKEAEAGWKSIGCRGPEKATGLYY